MKTRGDLLDKFLAGYGELVDRKRFKAVLQIIDRLPDWKENPLPAPIGNAIMLAFILSSTRIGVLSEDARLFFYDAVARIFSGVDSGTLPDVPVADAVGQPLLMGDASDLTGIMRGLGKLLIERFDTLPDVALVLRINGTCRSMFAANPQQNPAGENPRAVMTEMLEQAAQQSRQLLEAG
jgi:hypothetical protein